MSKLRPRSKMTRDLERKATELGYDCFRTTTGHLRFVHRTTGKTVIAPSKGGGTLELNTYAELKRGTI